MRAKLILSAFALLLPVAASASNVLTDFSLTSNPNGVWSYGYGSSVPTAGTLTSFTPFTSTNPFLSSYNLSVWSNGAQLPAVGVTGAAGTNYGTVLIPANTYVFLHPGDGPDSDAIVEFTAATTGTYSVTSSFTHLDTANAGTGQYVNVYAGGFGLPATLLGTSYGANSGSTFDGTVFLTAGESLAFDVAENGTAAGSNSNDSTGLQVSITATPEPSSLVLLGTGILGLAGAARRKLRS